MGWFSGPANQDLDTIALGIAAQIMAVEMLKQLAPNERRSLVDKMSSEGQLTTMADIYAAIATFSNEQRLGSWKRGRLQSTVYFSFLKMGMDMPNAQAITRGIEALWK